MDTGLPVPDAIPSLEKLEEDLVLDLVQEIKFQPNLHQLPITTQVRIVFCAKEIVVVSIKLLEMINFICCYF